MYVNIDVTMAIEFNLTAMFFFKRLYFYFYSLYCYVTLNFALFYQWKLFYLLMKSVFSEKYEKLHDQTVDFWLNFQ